MIKRPKWRDDFDRDPAGFMIERVGLILLLLLLAIPVVVGAGFLIHDLAAS